MTTAPTAPTAHPPRDSALVVTTRSLTPLIAAAAALAIWKLSQVTGTSQVVIGRFGTEWLTLAAAGVGLLAGSHATVAWAFRLTRGLRRHGGAVSVVAASVRVLVALGVAAVWLLGMLGLWFATLFGYPSTFVSVGTADGHTIVVEANSSLAGLALNAGVRDGLLVTFPRTPASSWSQDGQATGFRPADPANYRLEVRGDTAVVHFRAAPGAPFDHSVSLPLAAVASGGTP